MKHLYILALLSTSLSACSAPSAQPTRVPVRVSDSSGVRVVDYPTLRPLPAPSSLKGENPLEATLAMVPPAFAPLGKPFAEVGGRRDATEEEFDARHAAFGMVRLTDDTVAVNDFQSLKFFGSDGTLKRSVGRRGSGPGEFSQTSGFCLLRGDTLIVSDFNGWHDNIDERPRKRNRRFSGRSTGRYESSGIRKIRSVRSRRRIPRYVVVAQHRGDVSRLSSC